MATWIGCGSIVEGVQAYEHWLGIPISCVGGMTSREAGTGPFCLSTKAMVRARLR